MHILAFFASDAPDAISSCTLDGQPIAIELIGLPPAVQCFTKQTIQYGTHNFVVTATPGFPKPLAFDYIAYVPNEGNVSVTGLDVGYGNQDPLIQMPGGIGLNSTGDTVDFTFIGECTSIYLMIPRTFNIWLVIPVVGYSLGIYGAFSFQTSQIPSPASYSIDGNMPVNFIISNQATKIVPEIDSTILVQTPRYSLGQHHFHLEFRGNQTTVPLNLAQIIVQNITTPDIILDSFPPNLSSNSIATNTTSFSVPISITTTTSSKTTTSLSTTTSSSITTPPSTTTTPSSTHHHLGLIIGTVTAGGILVLLTVLACFRRRRYLSTLFFKRHNNSHTSVEPIQQYYNTDQSGPEEYSAHRNVGDSDIPESRNDQPNLLGKRRLRDRVFENNGEQPAAPDDSIVVDHPPTYYTNTGFATTSSTSENHQPLANYWR